MKKFLLPLVLLSVMASCPSLLWARPEYAVAHGINRCTACHLSPVGGSVRNLYGKYYGARDYQPGPYSQQDLVSLDVRALYFRPQLRPETRGGLAWMAGIVSANIPLTQESASGEIQTSETSENKSETRLIFEHNIGGFSSAQPRNLYVRWRTYDDSTYNWYPQYILFGRFHAPFGLMSDEHRVYTRLQTRTTWNNFEMGALISGDWTSKVHYDFAVVNGEKTTGSGLTNDQAVLWGQILNVRFQPSSWPIMLGTSGSYHHRAKGHDSPYAGTLYALLSLDRLTRGLLSGSLMSEYSRARFWNSDNPGLLDLLSDPNGTYTNTVKRSESEAFMFQAQWNWTPHWGFIYRYDQLILDRQFPADAFDRHGIGFRHILGPNIILNGRMEFANAHHPSQHTSSGKGAIDGTWFVLQIGI